MTQYTTKKTSIRRILQDGKQDFPILEDAIFRTNRIVFHALNLLTSYFLAHRNDENLPIPDKDFIFMVFRVVSTVTRKGPETKHAYYPIFQEHYNTFYKELVRDEEPLLRDDLTQILDYEASTLVTNIKNNIIAQYRNRLMQLVNIDSKVKSRRKAVRRNKLLSKQERQARLTSISKEVNQVKQDILKDTRLSNPIFFPYITSVRQRFVPLIDVSVWYDVKANPFKFLVPFLRLHQRLGKFRILPLRTSGIPANITLDTEALRDLFGITSGKNKTPKDVIWDQVFRMGRKDFKMGKRKFHQLLHTDGVSVSLIFQELPGKIKPEKIRKKPKKGSDGEDENRKFYVREMDITHKNIVGIDPNKDDIMYGVGRRREVDPEKEKEKKIRVSGRRARRRDRNPKAPGTLKKNSPKLPNSEMLQVFRFTKSQRDFESKSKIYRRQREKLAEETLIEGLSVKEHEATLSAFNSKTSNVQEFHHYLAQKIRVANLLRKYYQREVFRKMRWNTFVNTCRMEEKMISKFKNLYGSPDKVIVCFGDYSQTHLKHSPPVKGKYYRDLFQRHGFQVFLVNEAYTSKRCHDCHQDLKKFKNIHGLLRCKNCQSGRRFWNRDLNAARNILEIAISEFEGNGRPGYLER